MADKHLSDQTPKLIERLIVGVGFHLIQMFYLPSPFPQQQAVWILRSGMFSLTAASVGLLFSVNSAMLMLTLFPRVAANIIYAVTV